MSRHLSLASIGSRFQLRKSRDEATNSPRDVQAHHKLFTLLLDDSNVDANQRQEYLEELIARWEELTGLWSTDKAAIDQTSPILRDDQLFAMYLRALAARASSATDPSTLFSRINEAPLKRQQVLDATSTSTSSAASSSTDTAKATTETESATSATLSTDSAATTSSSSSTQPSNSAARAGLTPSALISAIFGSGGRGKGGQPKIVNQGGYESWLAPLGTGAASAAAGAKTGSTPEPIRVIVEEAKSPLLLRAVRFIFVTALYSFLLLSLLSLLLDSSGILRAGAAQTQPFQPTPAPDPNDNSGRGTSFKDVHGCEEAKSELVEIVEFLKDPERFSKLGGRIPRGVLLTGPPGTGKTLLARAVAGEAGVNFFSASGSEFDEMYVGVGARRVRELFAAARKAAPAIVFIDELDAVGGKRSPRDQHFSKQTLNQILTELDGFTPGEGVILIGATNFPESLDKALVRPGRFDRHIVVPLPDVRGRMEILRHHMRKVNFDRQQVDISTIARGTIGFSGADLQALVNQAAVKASVEGAKAVRAIHFEWAKERIMMGAARKSAYITDQDKLATAYHEGGHALVALYTKGAYPLQSVTVIPRGQALGYTLMLPEMDKNSHSLAEYRAKLDVAMGGRVAEELVYGRDNVTDGASSDISNATSMASNMVRRFGFSDKIGPVAHTNDPEQPVSPATQEAIETEIRGLIEQAQERAKKLLTEKKEELDRLALALVEHETLDLQEVKKVISGESIQKSPLDTV
ncbi:i-AAA protease yme1 [Microbotryomycetes sp. JL221]|nr:i-AAA protease yme1 [Microbotryomycetes sp. JL221]